MTPTPITVAHGDGIGPEIMDATLRILEAAGASLAIETIEVGEKLYLAGNTAGIEDSAWDSLTRTKVFLKAPITTPQSGGMKSLNVTVRKTLGLYANVRPCVSYAPYIETKQEKMDLVIVRENEEDLYAGIEHQHTGEVAQCIKLITTTGSARIARYAFEYAVRNNRKRVTCITKDNIMKITDGMFRRIFEDVAQDYPQIEHDHMIVDIGAARIATRPERFDVICTLNLYGDIISDIAAEVAGSVGIAGSANIGEHCAMFEAIHGSAPDIAGKGIANPSGLLQGAIMMLVHIGQSSVATTVQNAWLRTIEDGIHTGDIYREAVSSRLVGTKEFADAVIERLGQSPQKLQSVVYSDAPPSVTRPVKVVPQPKRERIGIDIFVEANGISPDQLGNVMEQVRTDLITLKMISNRGVKVYPHGNPLTYCANQWRCRYFANNDGTLSQQDVLAIIQGVIDSGFEFLKFEPLFTFDGKRGFSMGQGE